MKRALLLTLLAAACQPQDAMTDNGVPASTAAAPGETAPATPATPAQAVQTATLTGLYEGPAAAGGRSQMCMVDRAAGGTRFAIVLRGPGSESCSGDGSAVRQGNVLRLNMAGDEACTVEARIEGGRIAFPATTAPGCAYYCSRGARFAGATFDKTGGRAEDAMRAEDLVGDRLCAGVG
ncbi:MAG: hypothetical protein QOI38_2437 [Sphingomonadales bacterium]|jgi:hypothetical protein|nr:hypothetical protein [Sphingomonadales bacterium]